MLTTLRLATLAMLVSTPGCSSDSTGEPTPPPVDLGTWANHAALPTPRTEGSAAVAGGLIYFVGGIDQRDGSTSSAVDVYNPAANSWTTGPALPAPRHHHTVSAVGGKLYVIGGYSHLQPPWPVVKTVFELDPASGTWRTLADLPSARGAHAAGVVNGKIHVVGGESGGSPIALHDIYDPATNTWSTAAPLPVALEHLAAAVTSANTLFVTGGRVQNGNVLDNRKTMFGWSAAVSQWVAQVDMPTARSGHSMAAFGTRLYAIGGERNGGLHAENEEYDIATGVWRAVAPIPIGRSAMGTAVFNGAVYLVGGSGPLVTAPAVYSYRPPAP